MAKQTTKPTKTTDRIIIDNPVQRQQQGQDNPPNPTLTRESRDKNLRSAIGVGPISPLKELTAALISNLTMIPEKRDHELVQLFSDIMKGEADLTLLITEMIFNDLQMSPDLNMEVYEIISKLDSVRFELLPFLKTNPDYHKIANRFGPRYIKNLTVKIGDLGLFFLQGDRFHSISVFGTSPKEASTWVSPMDRVSYITMTNWWSSYYQSLPFVTAEGGPVISIGDLAQRQMSVPILFANPEDFM
jgi:hypothetical protein